MGLPKSDKFFTLPCRSGARQFAAHGLACYNSRMSENNSGKNSFPISQPEVPGVDAPPPLRSVHTSNLPQLLDEGNFSLLVTTYQAGKLVILRNDRGVLNTHFRNCHKPMGLAVSGGKLALGYNIDIWEFHNVPAVCARLDSPRGSAGVVGESGKWLVARRKLRGLTSSGSCFTRNASSKFSLRSSMQSSSFPVSILLP